MVSIFEHWTRESTAKPPKREQTRPSTWNKGSDLWTTEEESHDWCKGTRTEKKSRRPGGGGGWRIPRCAWNSKNENETLISWNMPNSWEKKWISGTLWIQDLSNGPKQRVPPSGILYFEHVPRNECSKFLAGGGGGRKKNGRRLFFSVRAPLHWNIYWWFMRRFGWCLNALSTRLLKSEPKI